MQESAPIPGPRNLITDVDAIMVGNAEDHHALTGVSVVLPNHACVGAVDVRGGAPGTRETDALGPTCLVDTVDAVILSGGSVYGLDAAGGAVAWLSQEDRGYRLPAAGMVAPIVPSAILFDLSNGGDKGWGMTPPYRNLGISACEHAAQAFSLGNSGAGLGATAGQYKGGLGSASTIWPGWAAGKDLQVGALIAANPYGTPVIPGSAAFWAQPLAFGDELGMIQPPTRPDTPAPMAGSKADTAPGGNTTIGVVAVNAALTPAQAQRIAIMAQDGLARAVRPAHTPFDGDTLFVLATGAVPLSASAAADLTVIGSLAADCVARALARGVYHADSIAHLRSYRDIHGM
ncbi:MAG TPA: peptidase T4 [Alphaproteobacteria bacterium]|nr:peptidase T4 [Alphaproteobacteria bacterium]